MRIHVVQKGDTLWKIAKQYGIGFDELKRLNNHLSNPDYIVPGMEIILSDKVAGATSPSTKKQQTAPIQSMDQSKKKKMTEEIKPMKEIPMPELPVVPEMVAPEQMMMPELMPTQPVPTQPIQPIQPIMELRPEFNFDFAAQWHQYPQTSVQPAPMPMPMPVPMPQPAPQPAPQPLQIHPIIIDWPQPQPPKQESSEQPIMEKEIEYVPVPQPQYIYVPYMPQPMCSPCECEQMYPPIDPCGCHDGYPQMMMPQSTPCGCGQVQPTNDCGCGGQVMMPYEHPQMMPYEQQYFEPNYDILPSMEDCEEEQHHQLPGWLLESTECENELPHSHHQSKQQFSTDVCEEKEAQIADYYHQMYQLEQETTPLTGNVCHSQYPMMPMYQMPMHMPPFEQMPYMHQMPEMMHKAQPNYPHPIQSHPQQKPGSC